MEDHWLSLKQAARISGRPEDQLRQAVLESDIAAIPVDDDREYLVRLRDATDLTVRSARRGRAPITPRSSHSCLIPVVILAVFIGLVGLALHSLTSHNSGLNRQMATNATLKAVSMHIDLFHLDHGVYPEELIDLWMRPIYVNPENWPKGGYLLRMSELEDAWGFMLHYELAQREGGYSLWSCGADGRAGGYGVNEDIHYNR